MRRLLRFLLVLGVVAALGWAATHVRYGRKTAADHLLSWLESSPTLSRGLAMVRGLLPSSEPEPARAPKRKEPPRERARAEAERRAETEATPARVQLLAEAAEKLAREQEKPARSRNPQRAQRTKVDERLGNKEQKALDELVSSRVPRD